MSNEQDRSNDPGKRGDSLSNLVKGAISTGVRSVLVTEEGIRGVVSDFLPKEMTGYVKTQIDGIKKDVYQAVVTEVVTFLHQLDLASVARNVLTNVKMKVHIEVEFEDRERDKAKEKSKDKSKEKPKEKAAAEEVPKGE